MVAIEFDLIDRLFKPLAGPAALGLADDAAVLSPMAGQDLVFTKDLMIAGVHLRKADEPGVAAARLMRSNLSDLAAMGASPVGFLLGLAMAGTLDEDWLSPFAQTLAEDARTFECPLLGGDTTSGAQSTVLSLTAVGQVPHGGALRRRGARPGDLVYCTGVIGDGLLGLHAGDAGWPDAPSLRRRFTKPEPRLSWGQALRGMASAAIDVSDGLVADAGHIAEASDCALVIETDDVPLSESGRAWVGSDRDRLSRLITSGDDYELLFTISPLNDRKLAEIATQQPVTVSRIGVVEAGRGVSVKDNAGQHLTIGTAGYQHK